MSPPPPPLDPLVWKACAGTAVALPVAGAVVYYFPQGHAEQSASVPDLSSIPSRRGVHRCRITSVSFLANRDTDEVFAKLTLIPDSQSPAISAPDLSPDVVSFPKVLTPSDANNGGGFSVPRYCADMIFPPLDFEAEPPFQNINIRDVHGVVWEFRHIYRGTPRRHLLTTGWSKFVNSKKLVAGDSVIFMRNKAGELLVGIRRAVRTFGAAAEYMPDGKAEVNGFARNVKGRVLAETVVDAIRRAEAGQEFEVVYYPRCGVPDFVVNADVVDVATRVCWSPGVRVKMSVESEDASTMTCLHGTVSAMNVQDPNLWPGSPWRMLQVTLDEPKALRNTRSVNPWQVELASSAFHLQTTFPTLKRLKASPCSEYPNNIDPRIYYSVPTFMGDLSPPLFSYNHFPSSMQGARQSPCESNLTMLAHNNNNMSPDGSDVNKSPENLEYVCTDLSIGGTSQTDSSSPRSQSNELDLEIAETENNNSTKEVKAFVKLFGQHIPVNQKDVQVKVNLPWNL